MFRRAKAKDFIFARKNGSSLSGGELPFFSIMKTPDNLLKCHSKRCNQQALVIYRRRWFCVVHALASVRIRQFIRKLGGQ
jgi:hypothetical protein